MIVLAIVLVVGPCVRADDGENQRRLLANTVNQLRVDSHVIAIMLGKIRDLTIQDKPLPGSDMGTTELRGTSIIITVDVAKVLRNNHSLANTVVHEITHADDIARWPVGFARVEREDRALPWADRRLEKRAIQRTAAITAYLAMQYPDRYTSSITIELE